MEGITIEEIQGALSQLPEELRKELQGDSKEVDTIAIRMELIKFVTELHKHNQGVDWETNKVKPKKITFDQIILDAQRLYKFVIE